MLFLRPAEILTDEFIKPLIVFIEEPPEFRNDEGINTGMFSALALSQAFVRSVITQTVETLGVIKIKIMPTDTGLQTEEHFNPF